MLGGAKGLFGRRERGFTCGLDGYRSLLKEAGFERVDFYAPLPNARRPKELLPLGDPTVADFWVERSFPRDSARAKLLKWAFRLGILPRLVPAFGIVAQ